ncbi:hTAFII28-like protein conserved region-domain-containing protein [Aspergillus egyptiacus]|nr:hTAFII28-like protein conserved region-domain-containing protein [Aspergillus egyptiacus]
MSSPPPPNPLKRASISSASQSNAKRARMHPLRQTSFPVDADSRAFSAVTSDAGSVTGSFTGSVGGASADGVFRKKRGRKSKAEKERERERESEDAASVARGGGGGAATAAGGSGSVSGSGYAGGAGGGGGNNNVDEEEEDYEDEGELLGREEGGTATDTEAEKKNLALLVDAFNPLQSERYDLFKRTKLRKETLRRIVNHALSQSVPASVVTTINGFTKVFAGEIIEKARTVQKEWAEAHDQAALARLAEESSSGGGDDKGDADDKGEAHVAKTNDPHSAESVGGGPTGASQVSLLSASGGTTRVKLPPNPHRGQLLPSHLREALRRYKRDGEGGGVGFSGLSLGNLGTRGSVTWSAGGVGGRPIFR